MSQELWKPVPGFEDLYDVSDRGRVRRRETGRILKTDVPDKKNGYLYVGLSRKSKTYLFTLHSLVARAFLGDCPPGKEVNHIDAVKTNCRADNLEYLTHKENMQHASRLGLMTGATGDRHGTHTKPETVRRGDNHPSRKIDSTKAEDIRERWRNRGSLPFRLTKVALAEEYGVSDMLIGKIIRGEVW